jgi:hypothetical protein
MKVLGIILRSMPIIKPGDFDDDRVKALLTRHLESMHANSPPGHVFALDWSGLQKPDISFYALWEGEDLLGFGALKKSSRGPARSNPCALLMLIYGRESRRRFSITSSPKPANEAIPAFRWRLVPASLSSPRSSFIEGTASWMESLSADTTRVPLISSSILTWGPSQWATIAL